MKSALKYSQVVLLFSLLLCASLLEAKKVDFLRTGSQAPQLTLMGTNDKSYCFPATGSWNIVAYWSLFCHSCIDEMPTLHKELKKPQFKNLKAFFVSLDSVRMKKGLINFLKKRKLDTIVLMEEIASNSYVTADQWGVTTTPSLFIVSPQGTIKYSHQGPADMYMMLNKLEKLISKSTATTDTETATTNPSIENHDK